MAASRSGRNLSLAAAIAAAGLLISALPWLDRLDGWSNDILHLLAFTGQTPGETQETPAITVVALDEASYRREPFAGTPKVFWSPELAKVIDAALAHEAGAIGFDMIFPTSIEAYLPDFELPFLKSLLRGRQQGRLLLTKDQRGARPILPFPGQRIAIGGARNIVGTNLYAGPDHVVRAVPVRLNRKTGEFGLAAELYRRGRAAGASGGNIFDPAAAHFPDNRIWLNFARGLPRIEIYSLADIHACIVAGKSDYLRRAFAGRAVLIGAILDIEDRKLTSARLTSAETFAQKAVPCQAGPDKAAAGAVVPRRTLSGVLVHGTAVANLLDRSWLVAWDGPWFWGFALAGALLVAASAFGLSIPFSLAVLLAIEMCWLVAGHLAFGQGILLSFLRPLLASLLAYVGILAFRTLVLDRDLHLARRAFALYLPQAVIDRVVRRNELPELGGENRQVTILFTDLAGFTSRAEKMPAKDAAELLNRCYALMAAEVEAEGGFVDKFIGDAMVAIFGAPEVLADHAARALKAAQAIVERLATLELPATADARGPIRARIGLNTGQVLIGNIGAPRRFNYTATGDAVNLAARLENLNKQYDSDILVGEDTAAACAAALQVRPPRLREVDRVQVAGRTTPVAIFEPRDDGEEEHDGNYQEALNFYRSGEFDLATAAFQALANVDPVAGRQAGRARALATGIAPATWDGVTVYDEK